MLQHSFVITAHKESPYIETCVQHLLKQTVKSGITITTFTPSDFLQNIVDKYQLQYFVNHGPNSISDNWNFALSKQLRHWLRLPTRMIFMNLNTQQTL